MGIETKLQVLRKDQKVVIPKVELLPEDLIQIWINILAGEVSTLELAYSTQPILDKAREVTNGFHVLASVEGIKLTDPKSFTAMLSQPGVKELMREPNILSFNTSNIHGLSQYLLLTVKHLYGSPQSKNYPDHQSAIDGINKDYFSNNS